MRHFLACIVCLAASPATAETILHSAVLTNSVTDLDGATDVATRSLFMGAQGNLRAELGNGVAANDYKLFPWQFAFVRDLHTISPLEQSATISGVVDFEITDAANINMGYGTWGTGFVRLDDFSRTLDGDRHDSYRTRLGRGRHLLEWEYTLENDGTLTEHFTSFSTLVLGITEIPEPSAALLLVGVVGLVFCGRRLNACRHVRQQLE